MCERRSNLVFPNIYIGSWEADILEITKSGYTYEYEVKISKSDFKADFDFTNLICQKHVDLNRAMLSIGSLGGGNHFIEIGKNETHKFINGDGF